MERILEELARHTDDATRPDADLYLASGPVLRGRVVAVQRGLVTVHLGPAGSASTISSIAYIRGEQIIAVTVLAAAAPANLVEGPRPRSHHDDIITPINDLALAAMAAAMATPTPPEDRAPRRAEEIRRDDASAAFSAMRVDTGSVPAPDPIAEFVASQYDVITPPDPIVPPSLDLGRPSMQLEAPTYLGERPRPKAPTPSAKVSPAALAAVGQVAPPAEATFSMRGETPKPRGVRTPPPSRVDLVRQANVHAEMMSRVLRHRVEIAIAAPLDDDSRRAIGHALPVASDVLLAMFGEPQHRPALDAITSVELVAGDPEVVLDGARLVIRCSLVDRFTPASLRAAIDAA